MGANIAVSTVWEPESGIQQIDRLYLFIYLFIENSNGNINACNRATKNTRNP